MISEYAFAIFLLVLIPCMWYACNPVVQNFFATGEEYGGENASTALQIMRFAWDIFPVVLIGGIIIWMIIRSQKGEEEWEIPV